MGYILPHESNAHSPLNSSDPAAPGETALVLVSHGNRGIVLSPSRGEIEVHYRRSVGRPVCGDAVTVNHDAGEMAAVESIHPRRNSFARADARLRQQVVAANLDYVLVVIAAEPAPSRDLLERYLVAAHSLDIQPVIVLNKAELLADAAPADDGPLARLEEYAELGYTVVRTSCKANPGVAPLADLIAGHTSILVGQSGVGKSSLVNRLIPDVDIQTGTLSHSTGKGKHTTTSTMMYALPGEVRDPGFLVDSPGVWEYGLWEMEAGDLQHGFVEFQPFLGQCRFNNCLHASEPGCAVKQAVDQGQIRAWRYASYLRLLEQS